MRHILCNRTSLHWWAWELVRWESGGAFQYYCRWWQCRGGMWPNKDSLNPIFGILWIHKRIGVLWQCNSGVIILFLLLFVWGKKKNCWNRRSWVFFLFQQGQDCDHHQSKFYRLRKFNWAEKKKQRHLDREKIQWRRWVRDWFAGGRAIDGDTWRMHSRQLCNSAATLRRSSKGSVQACCCSKSSGMKSVTSPPTHCL